jgi:hypothetical protein
MDVRKALQEPTVQQSSLLTDDDDTPTIQFTDYLKKASEPRSVVSSSGSSRAKKKSAPGTAASPPRQTNRAQTRGSDKKKKATFNTPSNDVDMSQDFDFQGSLALFDKAEVFAEIRESDAVDPESRLVAHNRLKKGAADPQRKLGIHENVLDGGPRNTGQSKELLLSAEELVKQLVLTSSASLNMTTQRNSMDNNILYSISGIPVPTLTLEELLDTERIAATETGPNTDQMTENGGRTAAMLTLQALGGNRRIKPGNHNDRPLVVVLVGNNRTGAFGLSAARHLANHDCEVLVWVLGKESDLLSVNIITCGLLFCWAQCSLWQYRLSRTKSESFSRLAVKSSDR